MYKDSDYVLDGKLITDYGLVDLKLINDERYYKEALKRGFKGGEYKSNCKKKKYDKFYDGFIALQAINKLEGKRQITRVYECIYCGKWHLTSKTDEQHQENVKKKAAAKVKTRLIKFNSFISKELRYWGKKLKLR